VIKKREMGGAGDICQEKRNGWTNRIRECYQAEGKTTLTNDVPGAFTSSLTAHPKRWTH